MSQSTLRLTYTLHTLRRTCKQHNACADQWRVYRWVGVCTALSITGLILLSLVF